MNKHDRFISDSGSSVKTLYSPVLQDDGTITLVATGKVDMQEMMDLEAEECSIEAVLTRYANGDLDALNRFEPIYADVSEFPKTYAEFLQHAINAENGFYRLPVEIQKKYDNNWRNWLMAAGTEDWFMDLGLSNKPDSQAEEGIKEEGAAE